MDENKSYNADPSLQPRRFESDTQKIVRKHLEDKNHTITEEEIRNVRVGMSPQANESFINEFDEAKLGDDKSLNDQLTSYDLVERQ